MFQKSWWEVAAAYVQQCKAKGWNERSKGAMKKRYEILMNEGKNNQKYKLCDNLTFNGS